MIQEPIIGSRLAHEIRKGELDLKAHNPARSNFAFLVGERLIGVYGIASIRPGAVRVIRAWNYTGGTWDPIRKIYVPSEGRQLVALSPEKPVFLLEFNQDFSEVMDRVAFKCQRVTYHRSCDPGALGVELAQKELLFEQADLTEVEILG